jgi:thiol-disulfide isomerase/thioredoxin
MTIAALLFALVATPNLDETRSPILLDFQAEWCGPCKQMRPAIKQLVDNGYPVKEIDIDRSPDLANRYRVSAVPTFVVVDSRGRELDRTEGFQPAKQLADFYLRAKGKAKPQDDDGADRQIEEAREEPEERAAAEPEERRQAAATNPEPWKTVVRIKVQGNGSIGFGSGTIIHSTPEESIILTCAHVFKLEGRAPTHPSKFPMPIGIDLFDGVLHSKDRPQVHFVETVKGEAIDYDFDRDVGLIRIRPGRRLPASRVVPPSWAPRPQMKMTTGGCSEGHDATAWTTSVIKGGVKLFNNSVYEAIECQHAPKQGRSGGGLYTEDYYVAGVCDFAEPRGNHGFYATPRSIYSILNRNKLTALYLPANKQGGALLADDRPRPRRSSPASIARAQSPDSDESNKVLLPPPELLGIKAPAVAQNQDEDRNPSGKVAPKPSWRPIPAEGGTRELDTARSTDLKIAPDANNDQFDAPSEPSTAYVPEARDASDSRFKGKWRAVRSPDPMLSASGDR